MPAGVHKHLRTSLRAVLPIGWALSAVSVTAYVCFYLHSNLAATGSVEMLVILALALRLGSWPATAGALLAFGYLNFFFTPPLFSFSVTDPKNWVALLAFEGSALLVARLSSAVKRSAEEAQERQEEIAKLYEISRLLLLLRNDEKLAQQLAILLKKTFAAQEALVFDARRAEVGRAGEGGGELEALAKTAYFDNRDMRSPGERTIVRVLRVGTSPIGAYALSGSDISGISADSVASLAAIGMERVHATARENRARAERETEQLRTAVLDSLAHAYKTPLTVIRTAATGLLSGGRTGTGDHNLLLLIDSETKYLASLTTRLLQTSSLDANDLQVRASRLDLKLLLDDVVAAAAPVVTGHPVHVSGVADSVSLQADVKLIRTALLQLLENAAKYSEPESPITLSIEHNRATVSIEVHSAGAPIPREERGRIFERYYRGIAAAGSSGTGLGLSISRKIAEAHHGRVWLKESVTNGNTFVLELPRSVETENERVTPTHIDCRR